MNHPPYAIVINTSVARAAGTTENPTARKCRETLEAVDRCGHQLAMCRELYQEWMQQRPKEIAEPWQSDHRVVSLNDRERGRFSELARRVDELRTIFWLNPNRADVPDWLCRGAPEEEAYRLGAKSPSHAHSCPVD
jgi:hypothetical protein